MSDKSSLNSYNGGIQHIDTDNEREFLSSVQLATVPQQTFSKADKYYLQAAKLDDEAAELAQKLQDIKKSAEDFRMTAFDLRRLATHDRAHIQAELDATLSQYAEVLPRFESKPKRAQKLTDLILAVEEGTVLPGAVNDIARTLSSFHAAQVTKSRNNTGMLPVAYLVDGKVKRERSSSSSSDSFPGKKLKLDLSDEDLATHDDATSIAGTCSADEADEEKESDKESVILGSPARETCQKKCEDDANTQFISHQTPEFESSSPFADRIMPIKKSKKPKVDHEQSRGELKVSQAVDDDIPIVHNTEDAQAGKKKKKHRKKDRKSVSFQKEIVTDDLDAKRKASLKVQKIKHYGF